MTREERINQKAKELGQKYFPDESNIWARPNYEAQYVESACKEMIEWADKEVKEVDLENELEKLDNILYDLDGVAIKGATCYLTVKDVKDIAKQFFELGIQKAQKGGGG